MKKLLHKKIFVLFCAITVFLPQLVFASTIYIDSSHSDFFVGDIVLFSVRVDSESKNINAVEGSISLKTTPQSITLTDINTSGSKFPLWLKKPLPSVDTTDVSFSGGVQGGLNSNDAIIFNIVLKLEKVGQFTLAPNDSSVYLNDGNGTKDVTNSKNLVINVLPKKPNSAAINDLSNLASEDTTPPEPFEIHLGQEGSVFDGKKFLSFTTSDEQSGIAYYEIRENNLPSVRSGNTYVLREQNNPVKVTVTAYDLAGNARKSVYSSIPTSYITYIAYAIVSIVTLPVTILLVLIFRKIRK